MPVTCADILFIFVRYKLSHVTFFVPNYRFFEKYGFIGGHIEHVKGTVEGLLGNDISIEIISSNDISEIRDEFPVSNPNFSIKSIDALFGWADHYVRFAWAMLRRIFSSNADEWIYFRYSTSFLPILFLFLLLRRIFCPRLRLFVESNSFASNYYRHMRIFDRALGWFEYDLVLVSPNLQEHWYNVAGELSKPRVHIVPNGILESKCLPVGEKLSEFQSLTYLGVLKSNYGIEELCDSFSSIANEAGLTLDIIGDGPIKDFLIAKYADTKQIRFLGALRGKKLASYLTDNKFVFVYPGVDCFSFQSPVKLYDYLAFGKPIISVRQQNAEAVIGDFKSTIMCEVNTSAELLSAITELRSKKSYLDQYVKSAQEEAMEKFGWTSRIKHLLKSLNS